MDFQLEKSLLSEHQNCQHVIGCDEVGRGPLAGEVLAAAFSPSNFFIENSQHLSLADSKKTSAKQRAKVLNLLQFSLPCLEVFQKVDCFTQESIWGKAALSWVSAAQIDQINILQASLLAMEKAVKCLNPQYSLILIDGNKRLNCEISTCYQYPVVKGDAKSAVIATAAIYAKQARDQLMDYYHQQYPQYGLAQHKGYPTAMHLDRLKTYGPSPIHRQTFKGVSF